MQARVCRLPQNVMLNLNTSQRFLTRHLFLTVSVFSRGDSDTSSKNSGTGKDLQGN